MAVNSSFVGEAEIIYKAIWREKNMNGKEHLKNNGNSIYCCSGSVRYSNRWVPKAISGTSSPISCSFCTEKGVNFGPLSPKLMGSGTHYSKIDGFP